MRGFVIACIVAGCGSSSSTTHDASLGDGSPASDAPAIDAPAGSLGTVSSVVDLPSCPTGIPTALAGATCKQITITGCPGIATEAIDATVAILSPTGTAKGTIVHFSGSGGEGYEGTGMMQYQAAGFQQVFVAWATDWEQTTSSGILAAGCRPATALQWAWSEPTLHGGSTTTAFCGQGFSGGSGQLGYALARYGEGSLLDFVNELSGPPFARIDLGCDGDDPASATVCGATDTMRLPGSLDTWENIQAPLHCGSTGVPADEVARWQNDSIAIGGVYDYPHTDVEFFDCTYQSTAVTAMAQLYEQLIVQTESGDASTGITGYHCFTQADGCMGEGLGNGSTMAVDAMIAGCVPRH